MDFPKLPQIFDKDTVHIAGHKVPLALIAILVAVAGIIVMVKRGGLGTGPTAVTMPASVAGGDISGSTLPVDPSSIPPPNAPYNYVPPANDPGAIPPPTGPIGPASGPAILPPPTSPSDVPSSGLGAAGFGQATPAYNPSPYGPQATPAQAGIVQGFFAGLGLGPASAPSYSPAYNPAPAPPPQATPAQAAVVQGFFANLGFGPAPAPAPAVYNPPYNPSAPAGGRKYS